MVPHRARLFTFYSKVSIPYFAAEKISFCIKYSLCYPSCALFSAPSCAVITLNGAPSSAPVYFLFKGWYISNFPGGIIYWFKIFFCVTHRVHFLLPHRVQLTFWMVPHRALLFIFHFNAQFLTHRVQLLFWMVPHWAHLPATSSDGGLPYFATLTCPYERAIFFPSRIVFTSNGAPLSALV